MILLRRRGAGEPPQKQRKNKQKTRSHPPKKKKKKKKTTKEPKKTITIDRKHLSSTFGSISWSRGSTGGSRAVSLVTSGVVPERRFAFFDQVLSEVGLAVGSLGSFFLGGASLKWPFSFFLKVFSKPILERLHRVASEMVHCKMLYLCAFRSFLG